MLAGSKRDTLDYVDLVPGNLGLLVQTVRVHHPDESQHVECCRTGLFLCVERDPLYQSRDDERVLSVLVGVPVVHGLEVGEAVLEESLAVEAVELEPRQVLEEYQLAVLVELLYVPADVLVLGGEHAFGCPMCHYLSPFPVGGVLSISVGISGVNNVIVGFVVIALDIKLKVGPATFQVVVEVLVLFEGLGVVQVISSFVDTHSEDQVKDVTSANHADQSSKGNNAIQKQVGPGSHASYQQHREQKRHHMVGPRLEFGLVDLDGHRELLGQKHVDVHSASVTIYIDKVYHPQTYLTILLLLWSSFTLVKAVQDLCPVSLNAVTKTALISRSIPTDPHTKKVALFQNRCLLTSGRLLLNNFWTYCLSPSRLVAICSLINPLFSACSHSSLKQQSSSSFWQPKYSSRGLANGWSWLIQQCRIDRKGAIPEPLAIIIRGALGSVGNQKEEGRIRILIYLGRDRTNSLVSPIFPSFVKRDMMSQTSPAFHPASVQMRGILIPREAWCSSPRSNSLIISDEVRLLFSHKAGSLSSVLYFQQTYSFLHRYNASCMRDFVGLEELLIIFIKDLTGIGGKGSWWELEKVTLPVQRLSSIMFSGQISTLQAGVILELVCRRTKSVDLPEEGALISLTYRTRAFSDLRNFLTSKHRFRSWQSFWSHPSRVCFVTQAPYFLDSFLMQLRLIGTFSRCSLPTRWGITVLFHLAYPYNGYQITASLQQGSISSVAPKSKSRFLVFLAIPQKCSKVLLPNPNTANPICYKGFPWLRSFSSQSRNFQASSVGPPWPQVERKKTQILLVKNSSGLNSPRLQTMGRNP